MTLRTSTQYTFPPIKAKYWCYIEDSIIAGLPHAAFILFASIVWITTCRLMRSSPGSRAGLCDRALAHALAHAIEPWLTRSNLDLTTSWYSVSRCLSTTCIPVFYYHETTREKNSGDKKTFGIKREQHKNSCQKTELVLELDIHTGSNFILPDLAWPLTCKLPFRLRGTFSCESGLQLGSNVSRRVSLWNIWLQQSIQNTLQCKFLRSSLYLFLNPKLKFLSNFSCDVFRRYHTRKQQFTNTRSRSWKNAYSMLSFWH